MNIRVDLRSDTVTRPTPAMLAAMARAPVGDDVFGDDPTVVALQDELAHCLGFEGGLFMPTGTQSNLVALLSHCQRGDEYIVGQQAHTYRWEAGGAAVLGSVQPQPLNHLHDGRLDLAEVEAAIKPDDIHCARTRLLSLENTLGGRVMPMAYLKDATDLAHRHGLSTHLDGARLFNAAVAQAQRLGGTPMAQARAICEGFDSVSVCFSKGLGAPVGSMLLGSAEWLGRALRLRKMVGGGMRQVGYLAEAARYALNHHVDRLADDHALAQRLAQGLQGVPGLVVTPPDTNIVFLKLEGPAAAQADALQAHLEAHGVALTGLLSLRLVTHLDVDAAGIDWTVQVVREFFNAA